MDRPVRLGLVLAGGRGRRFGADKGWVERRGTTLAEGAAAALRPHCDRLLVSLRAGAANPAPSCEPVEDDPPAGRGPLAGISAAARLDPSAELLVLACDYPAVDHAQLARLLEHASDGVELVLAIDEDGRDHPLVALWRPAAIGLARRALADGRFRVGRVVDAVRAVRVPLMSASLLNVNRPDELPAD